MRIKLSGHSGAFTMIELLIVVIVCLLALASLFPDLAHRPNKRYVSQIVCVNNLKQIGLSFRLWAGDHAGSFPMHFKTNGFDGEKFANQRAMYIYFQVLSNELITPKVLVCPADKKRSVASDFTTNLSSAAVSYFVGVDSRMDLPQSFLAGDRNLGAAPGLGNNAPPTGYGYSEKGGVYVFGTSNMVVAWSDKMHDRQGDIAMGDGSVQKFTTARLRDALQNTGLQTNRLVFP